MEFNIHDLVGGMQFRCLTTLLNPFTIGRIQDNQVKFDDDDDVYTLAEHINTIADTVWSELNDADRKGTDRKPYICSLRRNLQRRFTDILMGMVLSDPGRTVPPDANAISRQCVTRLSEKIGKVLKKGDLDATSEAHLADVKNRIDKALEAEYMVGPRGGGNIFFRHAEEGSSPPVSVLPQR